MPKINFKLDRKAPESIYSIIFYSHEPKDNTWEQHGGVTINIKESVHYKRISAFGTNI